MITIVELYSLFQNHPCISTDTRKINQGDIFFALKGDNFNGNKYAKKALEKGASYSIVDEEGFEEDNRIILVDDVLKTLQSLATYHREQLKTKIVALTGSNGKTTTKELIRSVLSEKYKVLATRGNLNNHIGVPLTLLELKKDHDIGVIEMGANHQKEIEFLCNLAKPNYGLITNIGKAHLEGFGGEEGVFKGKTEMFTHLFKNKGQIFLNVDDEKLVKFQGYEKILDYGINGKYLKGELVKEAPFLQVKYKVNNKEKTVKSNMIGTYNFSNILAAIAIGCYFDITSEKIAKGIENYIPQNNRSQIKKINGNTVILDAYNANPTSVKHALDNFAKMEGNNKLAILGDMLELGEYSNAEHRKVINQLKDLKIEAVLVGKEYMNINQTDFRVYPNVMEAGNYIKSLKLNLDQLLLKGSRGIGLEKILEYL